MPVENRRPPIKGSFTVLVIPNEDVEIKGLTSPLAYTATQPTGIIRAVGNAGTDTSVGCCSWAFDTKSRMKVCNALRDLATWLEKNAIPD